MGTETDHLVVYIGGSGRSGSTILDMMLGANPSAFSTGQIDELRRWIETGRYCTCGRVLFECPFWGPLLDSEDFKSPPSLNATGRAGKVAATVRVLVAGRRESEANAVTATWSLLRLLASRSGKRVLIDSSKAALRAALLARGPEREHIRLVHLVRDPRGYVTSRSSATPAASAQGAIGYTAALSKPAAVADWIAQNVLTLAVGLVAYRGRYTVVTYEELTRNPSSTLARVAHFLGLDYEPSMLPPLDRGDFHLIGGNSSRLAFSELRYDAKWQSNLRTVEKFSILMAAGWLYALLRLKFGRGGRDTTVDRSRRRLS